MKFKILRLIIFLVLDENVLAPCGQGSTPLYLACQKGHKDVSEYLLRRGANPNARFKGKFTPLSIATQHRHEAVVALLKEYKAELANPDQVAEPGGSPSEAAKPSPVGEMN